MNEPKDDTLIYLEVDIRSKTSYPIIVSLVVKEFCFSRLSKIDGGSLIESLYKQGCFVPNLLIYDAVIKECIKISNDSTLVKYLGQGQKLMNLIVGNGREIKLILNSGENVFIRMTEIKGVFLFFSKNDIQLPSVSNEIVLNEIEEMNKMCLPLEIIQYNKPSRKCLREMFK